LNLVYFPTDLDFLTEKSFIWVGLNPKDYSLNTHMGSGSGRSSSSNGTGSSNSSKLEVVTAALIIAPITALLAAAVE